MSTTRELLPVAPGGVSAREAWRLLKRRPAALATTVVAYLTIGLAGVLPVLMIGRVVDVVRTDGASSDVVQSVVVIAISGLVGGLAATTAAAALAAAVAPALATLREDVLDRALHLESRRVEAAGVGDVVSRVGDDVRQISQSLDEAVPAMLTSLVTVVFTVGGLFTLDWRLGVAGFAAAPCYVLALRWYLPQAGPMYRAQRVAEGERADALVTGMHGAATLRAFGREASALDRVERTSGAAVDVTIGVFRLFTRFGFRMNISEMVGLGVVLTGGFVVVSTGTGTLGDATAAALFFHRLFNPIGALLFLFDTVQSAGAALTRLVGVSTLPAQEVHDGHPGDDLTLRVEGVHHAYEEGRPVLFPTDLVVAPGEHVALVGATGAGKTTLGAIAAGAVRPTGGRVLLGDLVLTDLHEAAVRHHVALVSQEVHVFAGTVRDNLLLAAPSADDAELNAALDVVGAGWVGTLPAGLDTRVGGHDHALTAPQAQQLALARVVLADPEVVVLDEATAEAGSSGARGLEEAAEAALRGRTALVIAHRLTQAEHADRVVVMDEGRIVESGSHDELVAAGGRYAALWAAWSS